MRIVLCNVDREKRGLLLGTSGFVYAGRDWVGYKDCGLGNPFVNKSSGRGVLAEFYRRWLWAEREGKAKRAWAAIATLRSTSVLGCWCVNKECAGVGDVECHCDIIARAWAWLQTQ